MMAYSAAGEGQILCSLNTLAYSHLGHAEVEKLGLQNVASFFSVVSLLPCMFCGSQKY